MAPLPSGGAGLPKPGTLGGAAFNKAFNTSFNRRQASINQLQKVVSSPGYKNAYGAVKVPKPAAPPKPPHVPTSLNPPETGGAAASPAPATNSQTQGSPLDATYYNNVAANLFKVNNSINALGLQGQQAGTSLQNTLAQLQYAQPRADLALEQKFNNAGGLYSSAENQGIGNLNYSYAGKEGAAQSKYDATARAIAAKIAALQGGVGVYNDAQAQAAAGRAAKAASQLAPPPPSATSPAPTAAPAASGGGGNAAAFNAAFNQKFNASYNARQAAINALARAVKGKK